MQPWGLSRAAVVALVALSASAGCAFSSFQTAKMLPPGGTRVGAAVNSYGYHADGGSGDTTGFEAMGSYGLSDKLELGGKFAFFSDQGERGYDILVSPKFSLQPDTLALTAQTGIVIVTSSDSGTSDSENIWLTMPGIVYTKQFTKDIGIDLTAKAVLEFSDNFDDYNIAGAGNVGFRLTPGGSAWALTPEVGVMYDDDASGGSGDNGYFLQIGFAFTYEFGGAPVAATPPVAPVPVAPTPAPPGPVMPAPEPAPAPEPTPGPAPAVP